MCNIFLVEWIHYYWDYRNQTEIYMNMTCMDVILVWRNNYEDGTIN
jgi:hypothetical protein